MDSNTNDYSKLLGLMKEKGINQIDMASELGISASTLSLKINNKADFKLSEIKKVCYLLQIEPIEIGKYFFNSKVQKN